MANFRDFEVRKEVLTQCYGLQDCKAQIRNDYFSTKGAEVYDNWDTFVFVQISCEQDAEMLELKNSLGLLVSVIGLAMCLIFKNSIAVYKKIDKINDKLFDAKLITLGDFSVMGDISEK